MKLDQVYDRSWVASHLRWAAAKVKLWAHLEAGTKKVPPHEGKVVDPNTLLDDGNQQTQIPSDEQWLQNLWEEKLTKMLTQEVS